MNSAMTNLSTKAEMKGNSLQNYSRPTRRRIRNNYKKLSSTFVSNWHNMQCSVLASAMFSLVGNQNKMVRVILIQRHIAQGL